MRDKPFGAALLEVAQQALLTDLAPHLEGRRRYTALMVANAIGIVAREIEAEARVAQAWERALAHVEGGADLEACATRLVTAIRGGAHDGDPALHKALRETGAVAAAIWKPGLG